MIGSQRIEGCWAPALTNHETKPDSDKHILIIQTTIRPTRGGNEYLAK